MPEDVFSHYLSYGATDQQTASELRGDYDGLLVPGTVAAFQAEGTKGFVLTLSASTHVPYFVDPRFPLFQQRLQAPKKSHESLASVLGDPALVSRDTDPVPADFTEGRIETIAEAWIDFNTAFQTVSNKHFDKYAKRLGETLLPNDSDGPRIIIPPYTMATSPSDPWWDVSQRLWSASVTIASERGLKTPLAQVVAGERADTLFELISATTGTDLIVWLNGLDERETSQVGVQRLVQYASAVRRAAVSGKSVFALYGGFFSVLLGTLGLGGASHGIGYGENRSWVELPNSGPPPARFYLPSAHKYVSQDLAAYFWESGTGLAQCACGQCEGRNPGSLDYHGLMKHSVHARAQEIIEWSRLAPEVAASRLDHAALDAQQILDQTFVPPPLRKQAASAFAQLRPWASALRAGAQL